MLKAHTALELVDFSFPKNAEKNPDLQYSFRTPWYVTYLIARPRQVNLSFRNKKTVSPNLEREVGDDSDLVAPPDQLRRQRAHRDHHGLGDEGQVEQHRAGLGGRGVQERSHVVLIVAVVEQEEHTTAEAGREEGTELKPAALLLLLFSPEGTYPKAPFLSHSISPPQTHSHAPHPHPHPPPPADAPCVGESPSKKKFAFAQYSKYSLSSMQKKN